MKKLIAISLLVLFGMALAAPAPELDVWYPVPFLGSGRSGTHTLLNDKNMSGLKDTSALVALLSGVQSISFMFDADSGTTGAVIGDDDSLGLRGKYIYPGQTFASGVWIDGQSADSIYNGATSDSGSTGSYHFTLIHDSMFISVAIPPPDTAGGSAALRYYYTGNEYDLKAQYIQLLFYASDSTSINGTIWIRQNSAMAATAFGVGVGFNKK